MVAADLNKQANALMSFFTKTCPNAPRMNRAIEKWAARDLIESFGVDDCKAAVEWYAKVNVQPTWKNFVRVAGDCINESNLYQNDIAKRRKFRAIANEWRNS